MTISDLFVKPIVKLVWIHLLNYLNLNDSPAKLLYDWFIRVDEHKSISSKDDNVYTYNSSAYHSKLWQTFDRQLKN